MYNFNFIKTTYSYKWGICTKMLFLSSNIIGDYYLVLFVLLVTTKFSILPL